MIGCHHRILIPSQRFNPGFAWVIRLFDAGLTEVETTPLDR